MTDISKEGCQVSLYVDIPPRVYLERLSPFFAMQRRESDGEVRGGRKEMLVDPRIGYGLV